MHFHLPRRHRRKLFFPAGLLALAGLLWLGCVAVGPWRERLKRQYVMQLTMPVYLPQGERGSIRFLLPKPDTVCKTCTWTDVYLTNQNALTDKGEQAAVTKVIRAIASDSGRDAGVRIHLLPGARYRHLVFALNTVKQGNIRKYWLDIHHSPTTLYAFVDHPTLTPGPQLLDCISGSFAYREPPVPQKPLWVQFDNLVTAFWQFEWAERRLHLLQHPEWRWTVALLAAIAALSSWRIFRTWRVGK